MRRIGKTQVDTITHLSEGHVSLYLLLLGIQKVNHGRWKSPLVIGSSIVVVVVVAVATLIEICGRLFGLPTPSVGSGCMTMFGFRRGRGRYLKQVVCLGWMDGLSCIWSIKNKKYFETQTTI